MVHMAMAQAIQSGIAYTGQPIRAGIATQIGTTVGSGIVPTGVTGPMNGFSPMPAPIAIISIIPVISSKVVLPLGLSEDGLTCTQMRVTRIKSTAAIITNGISAF